MTKIVLSYVKEGCSISYQNRKKVFDWCQSLFLEWAISVSKMQWPDYKKMCHKKRNVEYFISLSFLGILRSFWKPKGSHKGFTIKLLLADPFQRC